MKLELRELAARHPAARRRRGAGAAAAGPAGGRRRAGGGDRPVGRRQDHAAAGAWPARCRRAPARCSSTGSDPWALPRRELQRAARPAVPGAAGAAAAAAPARGHRGAGRPAAGDGPARPACARCSIPTTSRRRTTRCSASTWPTSCSSASTACPAASASASAWRARCWRRPSCGWWTSRCRRWTRRAPSRRWPRWCSRRANAASRWWPRCTRWTPRWRNFPRIVGLRDGALVFDLPAAEVSARTAGPAVRAARGRAARPTPPAPPDRAGAAAERAGGDALPMSCSAEHRHRPQLPACARRRRATRPGSAACSGSVPALVLLWPLLVATEFRPWMLFEAANLKVTGAVPGQLPAAGAFGRVPGDGGARDLAHGGHRHRRA